MSSYLDAINFVIAQVGATATDDENDTLPDVTDAKLRLEEADLWLQKKGWWFNTDLDVELSPDENDQIPIPAGTLKILTHTSGFLLLRDDGFMYNPYTQSNLFPDTDHFHLDLIIRLPWVDLPQSAQDVIKLHAAQQMIIIRLEDYRKAERLDGQMSEAMADVKKDDLEVKKRNARYGPTSILVRGGVRPYRHGYRNLNIPGGGR